MFLISYYQTMTRRDWRTYRSYFWDDAIITTVWQKEGENNESVHITTIDEFIAQTHLGPDSQPVFEEKPIDIQITVKNGLAQAWVRYEARFGSEKNMMEWKGTDLFSLLNHDGKWRIVSLTFSSEDSPQ
nr:nuclear transport factor 2 family protein [Fulvivirga imtechensis]